MLTVFEGVGEQGQSFPPSLLCRNTLLYQALKCVPSSAPRGPAQRHPVHLPKGRSILERLKLNPPSYPL